MNYHSEMLWAITFAFISAINFGLIIVETNQLWVIWYALCLWGSGSMFTDSLSRMYFALRQQRR